MNKKRIWELDFLRGLFILCMVVVHAIYDLRMFMDLKINTPKIYDFVQDNGGILFILISGICITLGSHFIKRGLIVFACGLLVSAVTFVMAHMEMTDESTIIYWGILHLLGFCMIIYIIFRYLPTWILFPVAVLMIMLGYYFETLTVNTWWLCFAGLTPAGFATGDFFPIFPHLGWFTMGVVLGRIFYKKKQTLFPNVSEHALPIRALSFCGRHSLWIYLAHQPILYGLILLVS